MCDSTVKTTVKMMTDWLHDYVNQSGSDSLHADLAHHAPFYAVCQAVFYVFSFQNQQLVEHHKGEWALIAALCFPTIPVAHGEDFHFTLPGRHIRLLLYDIFYSVCVFVCICVFMCGHVCVHVCVCAVCLFRVNTLSCGAWNSCDMPHHTSVLSTNNSRLRSSSGLIAV